MKIAFLLAGLLAVSFIFHRAAATHWFFDLFRNFLLQYCIGAALFLLLFLYMREWALAAVMAVILISCFTSIRLTKMDPWRIAAPQTLAPGQPYFRVAQYNKFFVNRNYAEIDAWARGSAAPFDAIVIQESTPQDQAEWQKLKDEYPYQFPAAGVAPENDTYILSRHPMTGEYVHVSYGKETGKLVRFTITKPGFAGPVTFYANHTKVPFGTYAHNSRDMKLRATGNLIGQDKSPYIVAIGDWNSTPFAPVFADFVRNSGLRYTYFGLWPVTSWPSFLFLPFLKIPIDHTMGSQNLTLIDQRRGANMGSDHHPLISTFVAVP